eukprot:scaffold23793_cov64-Phaeocystis_antarctica.AAC.1
MAARLWLYTASVYLLYGLLEQEVPKGLALRQPHAHDQSGGLRAGRAGGAARASSRSRRWRRPRR